MADVFRPTYTKPIPDGADLFTRKGKTFARFLNPAGKAETAPITANGTGILVEQANWAGYYKDYRGKRRKASLCSDRAASRSLLGELKKTMGLLRAGRPIPSIDEVPPIIRDVVERALEDSGQASKAHRLCRDPIESHVEDYLAHLESGGTTIGHRREVKRCLDTVIEACGFATLADVEIGLLVRFVNEKRKAEASARTTNVYCDRLRSFVRWAVNTGRVPSDPLVGMTRRNERKERVRVRRPLTPGEITLLLDATYKRPLEQRVLGHRGRKITDEERRRLGEERRLIYALMLYTGLRIGEVRKLNWSDVELQGEEPVLLVREAVSKNAQRAALPLHPWLVGLLAEWKTKNGGEEATGSIVYVPSSILRVLDRDLAFAGIDKEDASGRTVDLHACRHTFISLLAAQKAHPRVAQRLARHAKVEMTMGVYTHLYVGDDVRAIEALPTPEATAGMEAEKVELQATGTTDVRPAKGPHVRPHVQNPVHAPYPAKHPASRPDTGGTMAVESSPLAKASHHGPVCTKKARKSSPDHRAHQLGRTGLEPVTSCVSSRRSSQLS